MFTWICPKCGGDVPPSMNECPRCSAQTSADTPAAAPPVQAAMAPPAPPPVVPPAAATPVPPPPSGTLFGQPASAPPPAYAPAPPAYAPPPKHGLSPMLVAVLAMAGIAGLLAVLFLWVIPSNRAGEEAAAATAPATAAQNRHPLAKHLEVAGVRIVEPGNGSAKIQFVVVNHSAADLPEMKMEVTVRAADKDFFTFPVNLPSIGPYESKELSATVKTELKPYELPDWQTIRPQFVLTSEP